MSGGEFPIPLFLVIALKIRGETVDDFISQAQDRTRNAHAKSVAAAWCVWKELLQQDQITFESERISSHSCIHEVSCLKLLD